VAYFNSCVNPIIYNRTSKDFRDAFRAVFRFQSGSGGGGKTFNRIDAGGMSKCSPTTVQDMDQMVRLMPTVTTTTNDGGEGGDGGDEGDSELQNGGGNATMIVNVHVEEEASLEASF